MGSKVMMAKRAKAEESEKLGSSEAAGEVWVRVRKASG
jgi:hypothetical protein